MKHLSIDTKEAIVHKALNRGDEPLESIAQNHNIAYSTLLSWLKRYRDHGTLRRRGVNERHIDKVSRSEKFKHILATHDLDDLSLGQYCRENGLYSHQLATWRASFMSESKQSNDQSLKAELNQLKHENKQLKKELRRKDKALAEASDINNRTSLTHDTSNAVVHA